MSIRVPRKVNLDLRHFEVRNARSRSRKTAEAIIDHGRKEEGSIKINGRSSTRGYVKVDKVSSMPFAKCVIYIKVDHGGKNDLKKHSITEKHTRLQKSQNTTAPVTNYFTANADTEDVIRSETLFTNFVAEHNLAFAVADHFIRLCKQMFPDSKICIFENIFSICPNSIACECDPEDNTSYSQCDNNNVIICSTLD